MKDYMANGRFSQGITQVIAGASLVCQRMWWNKVDLVFYGDVEWAVMKALET